MFAHLICPDKLRNSWRMQWLFTPGVIFLTGYFLVPGWIKEDIIG
jgi:hypothetical protein